MNRYSNSTKVVKLVVDEEDNSIQNQSNMNKIVASETGLQNDKIESKEEKSDM